MLSIIDHATTVLYYDVLKLEIDPALLRSQFFTDISKHALLPPLLTSTFRTVHASVRVTTNMSLSSRLVTRRV